MNAKISVKKRIVSSILTAVLVLSMLPLSVFAADGACEHIDISPVDAKCDICGAAMTDIEDVGALIIDPEGRTAYVSVSTFQNQFSIWEKTAIDKIVLLADIPAGTKDYEFRGDITLDLNGHTLPCIFVGWQRYDEETGEIKNSGSGNLTVCDSVGTGGVTEAVQVLSSKNADTAPSLLTVEGGIFGTEDGDSVTGIQLESGNVNINGGTVWNIGCEGGSGTVNIAGGSVKKISAVNPYYDSETGEEGQYTLNVTGGSGHSGDWNVTGGNWNISGGVFGEITFGDPGIRSQNSFISGGTFEKISNKSSFGSDRNIPLSELLKDGYAFYSKSSDDSDYDKCENAGSVFELNNVSVKSHTHTSVENGVCAECGRACNHNSGKIDYENGNCLTCGKQLEAAVKYKNGAVLGFESFISALDSVPHNMSEEVTVVLLQDYTLNNTRSLNKNNNIKLDINSKTVSGSGGFAVENHSKLTLSNGSLNEKITVEAAGGDLTVDATFGNIGTVKVSNEESKVSLSGGNIENFSLPSVKTEALKNIKLSGGKFGTVKFDEKGTVAITDMLEVGYAFKDNKGILSKDSSKLVPYGLTVSTDTRFAELEVVKCEHGAVNEVKGYCNYCGKLYAAKITYKNGNVSYVESLDDWTLILAENGTVKLLQDADRCNVSRSMTFDLNGRHVNTLDLSADGTVTVKGSGSIDNLILGYNYNGDVKDTTLIIEKPTVGTVNVGFLAVKKSTKTKLEGWSFGQIARYDGLMLSDLLADGYALFDKNSGKPVYFSGNDTGAIANYYIDKHEHTFTANSDGRDECECGLICDHTNINENGVCESCKTQIYFAVLTKADDTKQNYKSFTDAWTAAIENNGSTLKLLCDLDLGSGDGSSVLNAYSGKFTLDLGGYTLEGTAQNTVIRVSDTDDIKIVNGKIENKFDGSGSSLSTTDANAVRVESGAALTLDGVEFTAGSNENTSGSAVYVIDGKLTVTDSKFNGLVMLLKRTSDVSVKLASSDFLYGIAYGYVGTKIEYETVSGFFADGNMLFDADGKYIDITDGSLWEWDDVGAYKAFTFSFADSCSVKPHTHTYANGVCSECSYACPHNSGKNEREASYFEKAICSVCHAEYGDYAKDTTAPTGKIKVKERTWWQSLLNVISFGVFFKEEVTVEITADDDSYGKPGFDKTKHAVKIEYLISIAPLSEETVKKCVFNKYTEPFAVSDDNNYVIYAKLTDFAGNESYAATEGFVVDTLPPVIEGYENGETVNACGDLTLTFKDENLDKVMQIVSDTSGNDTESPLTLTDGKYTLIPASKPYIIKASDKAGNITTVTFNVGWMHSFDPETKKCRHCGKNALIEQTIDGKTELYDNLDSATDALREAGEYESAELKLLGNIEKIGSIIDWSLGKRIFNLNGYTFSNTPTADGWGGKLYATGDIDMTVTGGGTMDTDFYVYNGGNLTIDLGDGRMKKLIQSSGSLEVVSGTVDSLEVSRNDNDPEASRTTELCGGHYGEIKIVGIDGLTCADLLCRGFLFEGLTLEQARVTELHDVTVVPCYHEHIDKNYLCTDCGIQFVAAVRKGNVETLFYTFEGAIRDAEQNDGCTVKLLQDIKLDEAMAGSLIVDGYKVELTTGKYTIDLNGKALDVNISQLAVFENSDLTIGDSAGGGKVISSIGAIIRTGNSVNNNAKLTVTGGDFNIVLRTYDRSALVLKGGSFDKYVVSDRVARCSPFVYLSDGYTFALTNPASGNNYANEGNVEVDHDGSQIIRNVTVVPVPLTIDEQPTDLEFYLTSQENDKYVKFVVSTIEEWQGERFRITFEKEDGTVIKEATATAFEKQEITLSAVNFKVSDSGSYRIKLELKGYVLYTNTFSVTVSVCEHPGYDENNKCTQCGCKITAIITNGETQKGYITFAEALAAAQSDANKDCTLKLLADTNEEITAENGSFRLDAGGYSVNGNITVKGNSKLTLENGFFNGSVTAESGELRIDGGIYKNNMSVKAGSKLFIYSGSCSGTVTAEPGSNLTVRNGGMKNIVAKSGSTLTVSNGSHTNVTIEENVNTVLSGGYFDKISVEGCKLIDCLDEDRAFVDNVSKKTVDGRGSEATNVHITEHTHSCLWNTDTHEKLCDCGYVETVDTEAPVISDIENGKLYYGAKEFSVADKNEFTVTVDGTPVRLTLGSYIIEPDNKAHIITATDAAGNSTSVTVTVFKLYKVTLSKGAGYNVKGDPLAGHGTDYTFTVEIAEGYSKTDSFSVDVNGMPLRSDNGTYTYPNVGSDIYVTVFGVEDITPPDAEISVGTNKFKEFLNTVSFGLFFKKTQTVTVTASDNGSGINTAEYLLSDAVFTDKTSVTGDWTQLTLKDGTASFGIEANKKAYIYIRVTDKSGNIRIINSDGIVVYTDSEKITESVGFTMLGNNDITFDVRLNGNTVKALYNGTEPIDSSNYSVSESGKITLKNSYLKTLNSGEYTVRVAYNPLGETYTAGDKPEMTAVRLTVEKATVKMEFSANTFKKEYDGKPIETPDYTLDSNGAVTLEYKPFGADNSEYGTSVPKNAGRYTLRISVAETDTHKSAFMEHEYEILQRAVKINGVTAQASKTYDGSTEAKITNTGTLSENFDGDNLKIKAGKAAYDSKNVGTGKTVAFTDFSLSGSAAANYRLISQPEDKTAAITAKELKIGDLKIKDKYYDGKNTAVIDGTPCLLGLVDGDRLELLNGVPTFDSINAGKNISVSFTEFTLSGDNVTVGNYRLTPPLGITGNILEYISDGNEYSVNSNNWINTDFVITAKDGYLLSLTNTADGKWSNTLTASEETANGAVTYYVKNTVNGAISTKITQEYKIDKTAPTGEIKLNERSAFQTVLNKISFGLLFKSNVKVKLTASDDVSGVKSARYYKSDRVLGYEEIGAVSDWTEKNEFDIAAKDKDKFIIYVRIEDNAGNICYIGSDGAIFDTAAPVINGVENGKTYYVSQRVEIKDENFARATLNGASVDKVFTVPGNTEAVYVIKTADIAGNTAECTIYMKPIDTVIKSGGDIENAKNELNSALTELENNPEHEKIPELKEQLEAVKKALGSIEKAETAIKEINSLPSPEDAKLVNKKEVERISGILKELSDNEKLMIGTAAIDKVKNLEKRIAELEKISYAPTIIEGAGQQWNEKSGKNALFRSNAEFSEFVKVLIDGAELDKKHYIVYEGSTVVEISEEYLSSLAPGNHTMSIVSVNGKADTVFTVVKEEKPVSPKTGETNNPSLWIALLFVSGGIFGITAKRKRKRTEKSL